MTASTQAITSQHAASSLIEAAAQFYARGWMMGTSGNLSLRLSSEPLEYLITASGRPKGALMPEDMVCLGPGQTPLSANQPKPSAETALHEMIYTLCPDAGAVFHVHTVAATALSMLVSGDAIVLEGLEMIKGLGASTHQAELCLPLVDNTQDINGLAQRLSGLLNPAVPGLLLRGHGLYAWGRDAQEAQNRLECWDFLFQVMLEMKKSSSRWSSESQA